MNVTEYTKQGLRRFTDKRGNSFLLSPKAFDHIQKDNKIEDPLSYIEDVFTNTTAIIHSKNHLDRLVYFREVRKGLFKTVVADLSDSRIKSAFYQSQSKGGEVEWFSKNSLMR